MCLEKHTLLHSSMKSHKINADQIKKQSLTIISETVLPPPSTVCCLLPRSNHCCDLMSEILFLLLKFI